MFKRLQEWMLTVLKVPPEPTPPAGAPGSLRVFRAGRNYLRLRVVAWTGTQLAAIWGLLVSLYFINEVDYQMSLDRDQAAAVAPAVEPGPVRLQEVSPGVYEREGADAVDAVSEPIREQGRRDWFHRLTERFVPRPVYEIAKRTPPRVFFWIKFGEAVGVVFFAVQFFWTLISVWLDYAQRWYMVTDRSLRLRWGVLKIQETTMSFANLQQVSVHQGPLQRLLKLADVHVESAGGGSGGSDESEKDSMHRSSFHAVDNAAEIRDLILARLKRFRQAGLGDPDDPIAADLGADDDPTAAPIPATTTAHATTVAAARNVLAEVRALREALR